MSAVAVVGLGRMGSLIATRLRRAGHEVRGYDLDAAARERFAASGGTAPPTLTDALRDASIVLLLLPDSAAVEAALAPRDVRIALTDTIVVDMGSSDPVRTRALASDLAAAGIAFLDAPVSGGVSGARDGTLTIMAGGPDEVLDAVAPVLGNLGVVRRVGPVGSGHAVKALNNLLSASHLLLTSEVVLAGERFGVDPATLLDVVNGSSGRSGSSEVKWPRHILPGTYDSGFALRLMLKDVRTALDVLAAAGVSSALAEATADEWAEAAGALPAEADHTEVARWLRG